MELQPPPPSSVRSTPPPASSANPTLSSTNQASRRSSEVGSWLVVQCRPPSVDRASLPLWPGASTSDAEPERRRLKLPASGWSATGTKDGEALVTFTFVEMTVVPFSPTATALDGEVNDRAKIFCAAGLNEVYA